MQRTKNCAKLYSNVNEPYIDSPKTDRYFFETDTDISKFFPPVFGQLPIFDSPPIPIFQNLLTDIFADILTKYFG